MRVPFSYLDRQFANLEDYLDDLRRFVPTGDFTLGSALTEFENRFASLCKAPHAIGVGSGTDALLLSLKAANVGHGHEVITTTNTFIATVGAIAMAGATPVFVDSEQGFVIDPAKIEAAITPRTRAIMPVHYTGNVADMPAIAAIAKKHNLVIIEDACQAIGGHIHQHPVGSWGLTAAFSLHPLKNLNVWGDGGVIITHDDATAHKLRLLRNHGLTDRDHVAIFAHNSRLDTLQAVIGNRLIDQTAFITQRRIDIAARYDRELATLAPHVAIPPRRAGVKHVYHLYIIRAQRRDELLAFLHKQGVEAKIHYPIPMHLQPAAAHLNYKQGDFPQAEADSQCIITLPAHQHLTDEEITYTVQQVHAFYQGK